MILIPKIKLSKTILETDLREAYPGMLLPFDVASTSIPDLPTATCFRLPLRQEPSFFGQNAITPAQIEVLTFADWRREYTPLELPNSAPAAPLTSPDVQ